MIRRVSVRAIVLHQGKLLCVRLKPYKGSLREAGGTDYWCLPGGGLDEGEALIPGLEREMVEEIGVKPRVGNLLYVQQFAYNDKDYLEFFFHVTNSNDYLHIDLSKTTHGAEEIAEIGFIDAAGTKILPKFLMSEPLEAFAASNSPTKVISRL
ncbi:MAG TPA: NUDIX domain-containing protein [Candidatus Saccharimonadales bacterium]|nr:NUDIX domain-containing protein [Candidatus Saccharimonadales bacterium]